MKLLRYILICSLFAVGCSDNKDDPEGGTLTIHFKAVYDGQPLQTFVNYPYNTSQQIQFTLLSMYIADLRVYDQTSELIIHPIELVSMGFDDMQAATAGYTLMLENIPAGTYNGIRFGIGVPPDENIKKPADFPSSSPLSKTGYYWQGWESYIFMKTEGRLDTIGNGTPDLGFAMHSGSDALFRTIEGPVPIVIEKGKQTELTILFDYKKLLAGVDIKSNPQNHTIQDTTEVAKIVNNLATSISLIP